MAGINTKRGQKFCLVILAQHQAFHLSTLAKTLQAFIQNVSIQHTNYHQLCMCQVMCGPTHLQV